MISLQRDDRYSIKLEFDTNGARDLKEGLISALNNETKEVGIKKDSNVKSKERPLQSVIIARNEEKNKMYNDSSNLFIELDSDTIEYGLERLKECELGEDFYPAEFCEVELEKKQVTIHAFLIRN